MHAIDENLGINHDNGGVALFGNGSKSSAKNRWGEPVSKCLRCADC